MRLLAATCAVICALFLAAPLCWAGSLQDAEALLKAGQLKEAEAAFTTLLQETPTKAELHVGRARARIALKDLPGATADLDQAVTLRPDYAEAWRRRALLRVELKQINGALADMDKVVALAPTQAASYRNRAAIRLLAKNYNGAVADGTEAIRLEPGNAVGYVMRAQAWEQLGESRLALADYDKTLSLDPTHGVAKSHRATLRTAAGLPEAALPAATSAAKPANSATKAKSAEPALKTAEPALKPPAPAETSPRLTSTRDDEASRKPMPDTPTPGPDRLPAMRQRPIDNVLPLPVPQPVAALDIAALSQQAYAGAVSAGKEGLKIVLAPATAEENDRYDGLWAPAYLFPCAEVVDYLNRLNPPLAQFLGLRAAAAYTKSCYDRALADALMAAALKADEAADEAMTEVQAQANRLSQLQQALLKVSNAIRALGNPPDPTALMGKARKRVDDATAYVRNAGITDLVRELRTTNSVHLFIRGEGLVHSAGQRLVGSSDNPMIEREIKSFNEENRSEVTYNEMRFGYLKWDGDSFSGSVSFPLDDRLPLAPGNFKAFSVLGRVSSDGQNLLEFKLVMRQCNRDRGVSGDMESGFALRGLPLQDRLAGTMPNRQSLFRFAVEDLPGKDDRISTKNCSRALLAILDTMSGTVPTMQTSFGIYPKIVTGPFSSEMVLRDLRPVKIQVTLFRQTDAKSFEHENRIGQLSRYQTHGFFEGDRPWSTVSGAVVDLVEKARLAQEAKEARDRAAAEVLAAAEAKKALIEGLQKDIDYVTADLRHLNSLTKGDADFIDFQIDAKNAEVEGIRDRIRYIETGEYTHTPTQFDDRCRAQLVAKCEKEVKQMADLDRERRINEQLRRKLEPAQRDEAYRKSRELFAKGESLDPAKWKALNRDAYGLAQGKLEAEKKQADAVVQKWDDRVNYAEWTRTVADTSFGILSGMGGFSKVGLIYSFATTGTESGLQRYYETGSKSQAITKCLFEGTKTVITSVSDAADYTWTAVDAYYADPKATPGERMASVAGTLVSKYATSKVMGAVTEGVTCLVATSHPPGPGGYRPTARDAIEAAKFKQQMEMDEALAKHFLDTHTAMRRAEQTRAPGTDLARLQEETRRLACSVNSSYGAKVWLKYKAGGDQQRAFSRTMQSVHEELVPDLCQRLRAGRPNKEGKIVDKWDGELSFAPIRNASSGDSVGIDFDLAAAQQPDWIPGKGGAMQRNVWVTRDGKAASGEALAQDAQAAWNKLYRERTGYSPQISFENVTSRAHPEAYKDLAWVNITQPGGVDNLNRNLAQQAGDVTRVKAYDMINNDKLLLSHYQRRQEACRGTDKDIRTKVMTILDHEEKTAGKNWTPSQRARHEETKAFWNEVSEVMGGFGRQDIDPIAADRRIHELSGGRGLLDLVDRVGTMIESHGKGVGRNK
jgi:Flp pilus assembly protein TadD